jgi:hypothetical protein
LPKKKRDDVKRRNDENNDEESFQGISIRDLAIVGDQHSLISFVKYRREKREHIFGL